MNNQRAAYEFIVTIKGRQQKNQPKPFVYFCETIEQAEAHAQRILVEYARENVKATSLRELGETEFSTYYKVA